MSNDRRDDSVDGSVVEGFRWCRSVGATVRWGRDEHEPPCVVEVMAPGRSWELVRGVGASFEEAYHACKVEHAKRASDARHLAPQAVRSRPA